MSYVLIVILQVIGICFQVFPKIIELDKKFENDSFQDVVKTFWNADRFTLFLSGVIILLNIVAHYIVRTETTLPTDIKYFAIWDYAIALILGYAGQTIVYAWLGKAEKVLTKKADKLDNL